MIREAAPIKVIGRISFCLSSENYFDFSKKKMDLRKNVFFSFFILAICRQSLV
jgi:hypothetical protein